MIKNNPVSASHKLIFNYFIDTFISCSFVHTFPSKRSSVRNDVKGISTYLIYSAVGTWNHSSLICRWLCCCEHWKEYPHQLVYKTSQDICFQKWKSQGAEINCSSFSRTFKRFENYGMDRSYKFRALIDSYGKKLVSLIFMSKTFYKVKSWHN